MTYFLQQRRTNDRFHRLEAVIQVSRVVEDKASEVEGLKPT